MSDGAPSLRSRPGLREWLELATETTLDPDLAICDAHHHLWDRSPSFVERYLLPDLVEDMSGGHNVVSTVFVECGTMLRADGPEEYRCIGETEFANGVAAMSASGLYGPARAAAGIVGTADLRRGDAVADVLDAHIAAAGGRFKGIRQGAFWDPSPAIERHRTSPPEGLLRHGDFRSGFKHLQSRQLSFDAWCAHPQIPDVVDLARAFPDTVIVLDHLGGPLGIGSYAGIADEVFAHWSGTIAELARCQNVVVKLGGVHMPLNGHGWHLRDRPPTSEELADAARRYVERAIELFGTSRCMFESNFPVDKLSCSYTVLWNSFKLLATGYSVDERADLFHRTAERVYRLPATAEASSMPPP